MQGSWESRRPRVRLPWGAGVEGWVWGPGFAEREGEGWRLWGSCACPGPPSHITSLRPSLKFCDHLAQEQGTSLTSSWLPSPPPPLSLTVM